MATAAQVLANRENAQLSTGPTSPEGRAKSSMNALRHGLTTRGLIVLPGQEEAFAELETGLLAGLRPEGKLQDVLFRRILESAWNLHRCRLAEAKLYLSSSDPTIDPLLDDTSGIKSARIQKYARQSETSMIASLRELRQLQTENEYRHQAFPLTDKQRNDQEAFDQSVHALSDVCSVQAITKTLAQTHDGRKKEKESKTLARLLSFNAPRPSRANVQFEANPVDGHSETA